MVDLWSHDEQWSRRERGESELQRLDRNLVELVLMVVSVLFGILVGSLTAALGAAVYAVAWFVLPLRRRHRLQLVDEDS
jgi:TRAP-type mannitol/chloroaromatic compound transport system permease large subunit